MVLPFFFEVIGIRVLLSLSRTFVIGAELSSRPFCERNMLDAAVCAGGARPRKQWRKCGIRSPETRIAAPAPQKTSGRDKENH